jgi:hypothetical protein
MGIIVIVCEEVKLYSTVSELNPIVRLRYDGKEYSIIINCSKSVLYHAINSQYDLFINPCYVFSSITTMEWSSINTVLRYNLTNMSRMVSDSIPSSTCVGLTLDLNAGDIQGGLRYSVYLATIKNNLRAEIRTQKLQNMNMKRDLILY